MQLIQKRQQLGQATQIDVLNAQKSLQSLQSTLTQTKAGLRPASALMRPDRWLL